MVVGDDHIKTELAGAGDLIDGGDRAVNGDQQACWTGCKAFNVGKAEPVSILAAARYEPLDFGAKIAQCAHEDRRRADAVNVVVTVNQNRRAGSDVAERELDRVADLRKIARLVVIACAEELPRLSGVAQAAAHEQLRDRGIEL